MESVSSPDEEYKVVSLRLLSDDFQILEKYRGDLAHDAFVSALLRMLDTGAVKIKPAWVKDEETK
jgi:hypothetical protein